MLSTSVASLTQTLNTMSVSPRQHPPSDRSPAPLGSNSGIPRGNPTPSVATPAHYRKPSLGTGPAVKETFYHTRMPQGATRMSPYEMPSAEGMWFCHSMEVIYVKFFMIQTWVLGMFTH